MGFETTLENNAKRKKQKLKNQVISFKSKYNKVGFINIVISVIGLFEKNSLVDSLEMLKDLEFYLNIWHCAVKTQ